jgi:hypothetical protein
VIEARHLVRRSEHSAERSHRPLRMKRMHQSIARHEEREGPYPLIHDALIVGHASMPVHQYDLSVTTLISLLPARFARLKEMKWLVK